MTLSAMAHQYYLQKEYEAPNENTSGLPRLTGIKAQKIPNEFHAPTPFNDYFLQKDMRKNRQRKILRSIGTITSVILGIGLISAGAATGMPVLIFAGGFLVVASIKLNSIWPENHALKALRP